MAQQNKTSGDKTLSQNTYSIYSTTNTPKQMLKHHLLWKLYSENSSPVLTTVQNSYYFCSRFGHNTSMVPELITFAQTEEWSCNLKKTTKQVRQYPFPNFNHLAHRHTKPPYLVLNTCKSLILEVMFVPKHFVWIAVQGP